MNTFLITYNGGLKEVATIYAFRIEDAIKEFRLKYPKQSIEKVELQHVKQKSP